LDLVAFVYPQLRRLPSLFLYVNLLKENECANFFWNFLVIFINEGIFCFKEAKVASTPQVAALACLLAYLVASTPQVAIT
jgi:hypothetical protein